MIKFFRKIRQKTLAENKFSKYLLYAVSEIILVVIGILIAVKINNINNQNIDKQREYYYLESIKNDLQNDTLNFGLEIMQYKDIVKRKSPLIKENYRITSTDSLEIAIQSWTSITRQNNTTFKKLTNLKIYQTSTNDKLWSNIFKYYTVVNDKLNEWLDYEVEFSREDEKYWIYGQKDFEINSDTIPLYQKETERRENLISLIAEPTGRNRLKEEYKRKLQTIEVYEIMKENASKLLSKINEKLENRNQ